jgi:hypothetical protein
MGSKRRTQDVKSGQLQRRISQVDGLMSIHPESQSKRNKNQEGHQEEQRSLPTLIARFRGIAKEKQTRRPVRINKRNAAKQGEGGSSHRCVREQADGNERRSKAMRRRAGRGAIKRRMRVIEDRRRRRVEEGGRVRRGRGDVVLVERISVISMIATATNEAAESDITKPKDDERSQ